MPVMAYGADKVKRLERAIGGTPPKEALELSRAHLQRHVAQRFAKSQAALAETARMQEQSRELLFSHVRKDDPRIKRHIQKARALYERRARRTIKKPVRLQVEPRVIAGSNFWIKVPPYDDKWVFNNGGLVAQANASAGTYNLQAISRGDGNKEVAAGVAIWFFAPADDLFQRFAALLQYYDYWWDDATYYAAHNDMRTRLWIWGADENRWVAQADVQPAWSDGVGWLEDHGNWPQGGDDGTIAIETTFPAFGGHWYLGWVWSDASVYADSGYFAASSSYIHFDATIPYVVFGGLF